MHYFSSVSRGFMCFHYVFTLFSLNKHIHLVYFTCIQLHMYHTWYTNSTVLLVFSCVFTVFSLKKHVLLVYFTWIKKYICTILYTWNALFCKCICVFTEKTCTFGIFHMDTKIHMYNTLYMKCIVLLAFSCVVMCFHCVFTVSFHWRNILFGYFLHVYQNTHVLYFTHEMHCFASVFICIHWRNIYFWNISHVNKNTHVPYFINEMYSFWSVFMCVYFVSTEENVLFLYFTYIQKYKCFIPYTWNSLCC
jgi:hypothetical protein